MPESLQRAGGPAPRPRVLIVSNTPFLPATAGNRARIGRLVEYLRAREWDVGMLLLSDWGAETWDLAGMRGRVSFLEVAAPPRDLLARAVRRFGALVRHRTDRAPQSVDAWCPGWFRRRVRGLARRWEPDVVLVEYVFLSRVLESLPGNPLRVIDAHDVMHQREDAYRLAGLTPRWFFTSLDEERRGLARADLVLAISDEERAVLADMLPGGARVLTVPHAEPLRAAPPGAAVRDRLLCVASDNDLNVDGLRWFLDAVWPLVRAARPAELVICGGVCAKLGGVPDGVVLRGFVPVLDDEYARARLVLSPLRGGTGMKVKVAEALAHGRPVVATRVGAAGIAVDDDGAVTVTDEPHAFAGAILRHLADDEIWQRAVAATVRKADRLLAPDVVFGPLAVILEAHARRAP